MIALLSFMSACNHRSNTTEYNDSEASGISDSISIENRDTIPENSINIPKSLGIEDLKEFMNESEEADKYAEGIIPNIAEESNEYAYKLLCNKFDRFIVVDKSRMKVILLDKFGRTEKTYGMACAKNYGTKHKKGDSCTPEGFFSVEGIYDSTEWLFTDDNGVTSEKKGQFGPRFIRIRIPGTSQIGIHGTCAPWSIGSRASHGCIRIKNENILELVELVEPGMPVIIVPGRKDMEQNIINDVEIPWIPTTKTAKKPIIKESEKASEVMTAEDSVPTHKTDSVHFNHDSHKSELDSISIINHTIKED